MRRSNLPDAVFLGSAGLGVFMAYGVSPATVLSTAAALSAPVIALQVVRWLNVTDLRRPPAPPPAGPGTVV